MFLQKKALYNLLQLNLIQKNPTGYDTEEWQRENYRILPSEALFARLRETGIALGIAEFESLAKNFDTPEDLTESLAKHLLSLEYDKVYLAIFELWRRHFPERQSLSIFCDALDYQILAYERGEGTIAELQDSIAYLINILDRHVDDNIEPKIAFATIQTFCANNLANFLYDYIYDRLEEGNVPYANEILDGLSKYTKDSPWFEFLAALASIFQDPEEGYEKLEKIISKELKEPDLELYFDILTYLATTGNHSLFCKLANKTLPLLSTEYAFQEFASLCAAHYDYLELNSLANGITAILRQRPMHQQQASLSPTDPDLLELRKILKQKIHFAIEG